MSKYRKYKNGIYGIRYNDYYIIPEGEGRKKTGYHVIDGSQNIIFDTQKSIEDCRWLIDVSLATKEEKELIKKLYALEIIDLSIYYTQLLERKKERPLNPKELMMEKWLDPVRGRKADEKPLTEI